MGTELAMRAHVHRTHPYRESGGERLVCVFGRDGLALHNHVSR